MSTIIFIGTDVPEKHLVKKHKFKYRPDKEMLEKIMRDLAQHSRVSLDNVDIDINVEITLKEYNIKPDKIFWYENQLKDATTNT